MNDLCPVAASVTAMNLEDQPKTIGGSLLWLLKSQKFCNVIFTFPNRPERIPAHKFCLKARSPVFEQIFRMRKSGNVQGNEIEISECTPERFQQFLEFIYSDKFDVDFAGALDLLHLSIKYKVHPLTMKCEELLQTDIPVVDSIKVFEAARHYDRRELMDRAGRIMVKSFLELVRSDALENAQEETLVYLLECDELAVKEVGLFQFILDWGRNQIEPSADEELLRNKLKNLIPKIRYTNMAPDEFTSMVVPTGLLSAEDTISVYSYLCGNEVTRGHLKIKFNTTHRKVEIRAAVTKSLEFYVGQALRKWFPAFSKHSTSFKADRMEGDGKVCPYYLLMKTAITEIQLFWPSTRNQRSHSLNLNFIVSIGEHSGPVKEGNIATRFQKLLLSCYRGDFCRVSVDPPVELMPGRTYSVIVEDHSLSDMNLMDPEVYVGKCFPDTHREANIDLEDFCMTLKDIQTKTDYYVPKLPDMSEELALIHGITIQMV